MERESDDIHMCLSCHVLVEGLDNYVTHKKYQCPSKKVKFSPPKKGNKFDIRHSDNESGDLDIMKTEIPPNNAAILNNDNNQLSVSNEVEINDQINDTNKASLPLVLRQSEQPPTANLTDSVTSVPNNVDPVTHPHNELSLPTTITHSTEPFNTYNSNQTLVSPERYPIPEMFNEVGTNKINNIEYQYPVTSHTSVDPNLVINSNPSSSTKPDDIAKTLNDKHSEENKDNADMPDAASIAEFFSSLELRIRHPSEKRTFTYEQDNPPVTSSDLVSANVTNPSLSPNQKEDAFEERLKDIKISNILNNLNFSSDDEDLPSDVDDLLNFSEEDDEYRLYGGKWKPGGQHPPSSHTKGKWRPSGKLASFGKHGKKSNQMSGKWKPGMSGPDQTSGGKWKSGHRVLHGQGKYSKLQAYKMHKGLTDSEDDCEKVVSPKAKTKEGKTELEKHCNICNKTFKSHYYMNLHKETSYHKKRVASANGSHVQSMKCALCGKTQSNRHNYARHIASEHNREWSDSNDQATLLEQDPNLRELVMKLEPLQCRICGFYSRDVGEFRKHLCSKSHVVKCEGLLGPIYCKRCQVKCDSNTDLIKHIDSNSHRDITANSNRPIVIKEYRTNLECKKCGKILANYTKLCMHMKSAHVMSSNKPLKTAGIVNQPNCPYCGLQFRCKAILDIHIRRKHTGEKPFACDFCAVGFASNSDLQRHLLSEKHIDTVLQMGNMGLVNPNGKRKANTADMEDNGEVKRGKLLPTDVENKAKIKRVQLTCKYQGCTHVTFGKVSMKHHYDEVHNNGCRFKCNLCNYEVDHKSHYDVHCRSKKHLNLLQSSVDYDKNMMTKDQKSVKCDICDLAFMDTQSLHRHKLSHVTKSAVNELSNLHEKYQKFVKSLPDKGTVLVTCPEVNCRKSFKRKAIVEHLHTHTGRKSFCCVYCNKSFDRGERLRPHLHTHFPAIWHKCEHCPRKFRALSSLKQHILSHHPTHANFEASFVCATCGYKCMTRALMQAHMYSHMKEADRKYQCPWAGCSSYFQFKSAMTYHVRRRHTKERPHLCDQCGFAATDKQNLNRHKRKHAGIRNYKCEYCTYSYYNSTGLRRHMRLHINARPFKCPYQCKFTANNIEAIRKHVNFNRKHVSRGEFLYPCRHCNVGYRSQSELIDHITSVHNIDVTNRDTNIVALHPHILNKAEDLKCVPAGHRVHPVAEKYIAKKWKHQ